MRVTLGDMIRAHHGTAEFLWGQLNRPTEAPATPAVGATRAVTVAEGPHVSAPINDASGTWALREPGSKRRAQLQAEGWEFAAEAESPPQAKRKKPTRYLPPEPRFASWIKARGGSVALSAIARRFNLTAAEVDALLGRLTAAGIGIVMYHHGRGGGRRFVLLRTPRQPTTAAL